MKILKILQRESGIFIFLFIFLGLVSGVLNALLVPFIYNVVEKYSNSSEILYKEIGLYIALIFGIIFVQRFFSIFLINLTQKLVYKIRLEVLEKIRSANYRAFEKIGKEKIYTTLTRDASVVSFSATEIVFGTTSAITIVFSLIYLGYLSIIGLFFTLFVIGLGVSIYLLRQKAIYKDLKSARELETSFFKYINELLAGYKEAKVDEKKANDIYENYIKAISIESKMLNTKSIIKYTDNSLMGRICMLLLIGFVLFFFPRMSPGTIDTAKFITVVLYILGPIQAVMNVIPSVTQSNISLSQIEDISKKADEIIEEQGKGAREGFVFESLELRDVLFSYDTQNGETFSIGPISLSVNKGDFIFIAGGNGSGKTTLFKILTGLYVPTSGEIFLNGERVTDFSHYRSIFSPIYSDFHLFERLYGQKKVADETVNGYIKLMELEEKVTFKDGAFSQTSLSTGQRKRLALIASLLENKPVLVLDEWAADQDPVFRKFFYNTMLRGLKKEGKTIVAITHDDTYFGVADQLYKMEYGKINKLVVHEL